MKRRPAGQGVARPRQVVGGCLGGRCAGGAPGRPGTVRPCPRVARAARPIAHARACGDQPRPRRRRPGGGLPHRLQELGRHDLRTPRQRVQAHQRAWRRTTPHPLGSPVRRRVRHGHRDGAPHSGRRDRRDRPVRPACRTVRGAAADAQRLGRAGGEARRVAPEPPTGRHPRSQPTRRPRAHRVPVDDDRLAAARGHGSRPGPPGATAGLDAEPQTPIPPADSPDSLAPRPGDARSGRNEAAS